MNSKSIALFQNKIWQFYKENERIFAWREHITPYNVVVSEIMLQQTQTIRVVDKFNEWIKKFPTWVDLAQATELQVLQAWQGLGYNRRGLALHKIAQIVVQDYDSKLPEDPAILIKFPHIGPNTAASICAFAFNHPVTFIETNIRTVFSHEFFPGKTEISDHDLLLLIKQTVDKKNPRAWYYALMDYGNYLKKSLKNINSASKHYTKQSRFKGSKREVRGQIVKLLTEKNMPEQELLEKISSCLAHNKNDASVVIEDLIKEKIIKRKKDLLFL